MPEPLRVGLIGAGGMGALHAANLLKHAPGVALALVMDADPARSIDLARRLRSIACLDAEQLIANVDAVVIASPDETHAPLVLAAIAAGKPVFCEKPLAVTVAEATAIVEAELAAGRRLVTVGFMRRFDGRHLDLHALVASGALGWVGLVRGWHRSVAGDYEMTAAQVMRSALVHDFDSLPWIAGSPPVEIAVSAASTSEIPSSPDLFAVEMRLASGAIVFAEFHSRSAGGYDVGVEVTGAGGTATTGPAPAPLVRRGGVAGHSPDADWLAHFAGAYVAEVQAWAAVSRKGEQSGPNAWDGLAALVVAEAALEAHERGSRVHIEAPPRPALYA